MTPEEFEKHVERRARAIDPEAWGMRDARLSEVFWDKRCSASLKRARDTFAGDAEAGHVLVPEKATGAMLAAARTENTTICEDEINAAINAGAVKEE